MRLASGFDIIEGEGGVATDGCSDNLMFGLLRAHKKIGGNHGVGICVTEVVHVNEIYII